MASMVIGWPKYQPSVNGSETMPGPDKRGFFALFPAAAMAVSRQSCKNACAPERPPGCLGPRHGRDSPGLLGNFIGAGWVVRFENVGLRYGLGPEVLRDLTFRIEPHSFQFLTGPSGAGKTSLLRLLLLSLRPTRGLITLFDQDVATLNKDALSGLRQRIGIVFQDFRLLDHLTT